MSVEVITIEIHTHFKSIPKSERPYKCSVPECGRAFIQLSNLQQHMRSHCSLDKVAKNNDKKFVCNHCGKGFKGQSSLATHQSKTLICLSFRQKPKNRAKT
ncbi:unnamed protein product [Oppiella nova]|uniref:C2H2-type domain-containing protein n=1 Tax=Oppiella nova TaxID=334625 RepID=A0A7R9QSL9_9ACAR|nr:unnamed protein product [Oppiella nova]CAG2173470.1 unnamed protein product [Oppiella nova]